MPSKFAFVGAHGVGKTTLVAAVGKWINANGCAAETTPEVPRLICEMVQDPTFFRRGNTSLLKQTAILLAQMAVEHAPASAHGNALLCDRAVLDHWAYTKHLFQDDLAEAQLEEPLEHFVRLHCASYRLLIHIPIEFAPEDDGTREDHVVFQKDIDRLILNLLDSWNLPYTTIGGSLAIRVQKAVNVIRTRMSE